MAGYKRQSKKKSPIKKYGRREIVKLNVDEQKKTHQSNAKAQGSVGRAVGQIGRSIGKGVDTFLGNKKKKADDKKAETAQSIDDANAKLAETKVDEGQLKVEATEIEGSSKGVFQPAKLNPRSQGGGGAEGPAVVQPNTMIGGTQWEPGTTGTRYDSRVQDQPATLNDTWGISELPQSPAQLAQPGQSAAMGISARTDTVSPTHTEQPGGSWWDRAASALATPIRRSPINRISDDYKKSPFRRNPYGNSPLKRMASPFKREAQAADDLGGGNYVPQEETMRHLSYLGEEGQAGVEGYNDAIESHNYKQRVWAEKAKDVDDAYGKLTVEPTGVSSWDAAAQTMAMEWKKEYTDLYNNKDSYEPEEYAQRLDDIRSRASNYQAANQNINKIVQDYNERKDDISASTPSTSIDILETLAKGGDGLTTKNINGVPTLVGTTLGGQDVSVPISDIASGKNLWRVNEQYDVSGDLTKISDDLGKFKQKMAVNGGVTTSSIGWGQLQERAANQVDGILSNPQRAQAIAAEKFGIDYDEWQELGDEAATARVKEGLMQEVQEQFQPYQNTISQSAGTRSNLEQGIYEQNLRNPKPAGGSAVDKRSEEEATSIVNQINEVKDFNTNNLQVFVGGNIQGIQDIDGGGIGVVLKNGKGVKLSKDPKVARTQLARILGIDEAHIGKLNTPIQRNSPLRRMMNFITGK